MGYDPNRSRIAENTLNAFLAEDVGKEVKEVPFIGPKGAELLRAQGIHSYPELLAKYISLVVWDEGEDEATTVNVPATNQKFWHFIKSCGINTARSGIVNAINKKVAAMMPIFEDDAANYASLAGGI